MLKKPDARDLLLNSELGNVHEWGVGTYDGFKRNTGGIKRVDYTTIPLFVYKYDRGCFKMTIASALPEL